METRQTGQPANERGHEFDRVLSELECECRQTRTKRFPSHKSHPIISNQLRRAVKHFANIQSDVARHRAGDSAGTPTTERIGVVRLVFGCAHTFSRRCTTQFGVSLVALEANRLATS